jgi:diaminopimelate epimerase
MKLQFTKMHGAGNDFIVIDAISQNIESFTSDDWRALANRQFGIGADQILLVEKPHSKDADFKYRIMNSDGSEVEQCGNGSRCFVRFVREKGLTAKTDIKVEVAHAIITLSELSDQNVRVDMGTPIFIHEKIPFDSAGLNSKKSGDAELFSLPIENHSPVWVQAVSMGNPHAVQIVPKVKNAPVHIIGPLIENHFAFPNRVNAGFVEILGEHELKVRVFERGAGETLSCGTGACAAVVSSILQHRVKSPVLVHTNGGDLEISWDYANLGVDAPVVMVGPATFVFDGQIEI